MKKRIRILNAIFAFAIACTPFATTVQAATVIQEGNGYVILGGQGLDSLQETLDQIGTFLENNEIICPEFPITPENPGDFPEQNPDSQPEDSVNPGDADLPDDSVSGTPEASNPPEESNAPDDSIDSAPDHSEEESMNTYAKQVVDLVNQERAKAGLSQLSVDPSVTAAANVRAREIKESFSHTRPDGTSFATALKEQNVSYRGSGENIAWGQTSPEQVMDGWMNSEGHRANILNASFQNIGVGYYQDENGTKYWVQLFTY